MQEPICTQFKPSFLEGQVCYTLDLSKIKTNQTKQGTTFGLALLLDPIVKELDTLAETSNEESSARIYLNTLASFTDFKTGSYAMSVLKKMTGTENFLQLTSKDKFCQTETLEDCQAKRYIEEVKKECGCVPWALSVTLTQQVIKISVI